LAIFEKWLLKEFILNMFQSKIRLIIRHNISFGSGEGAGPLWAPLPGNVLGGERHWVGR